MSLELICKLLQSLPEQTGTGKNGPWVKQEMIVETEEQYPKKVALSAWGDMVGQFKSYAPGTRLKVSIRIESREYNGRWYTDVRPWRAEVLDAGANTSAPNAYASPQPSYSGMPEPVASPMSSAPADNDDLPF
ncbi:DUF3127 domain-containing protein [soil metagenome]